MHLRILHQINARNTCVHGWESSLIHSTCPGVLMGENYIGARAIAEAWSKVKIHSTDSITVLIINLKADQSAEKFAACWYAS